MKVHLILLIVFLGVFHCEVIPDQNALSENKIAKLSLYNEWKVSNPRVFMNADEQVFRQAIFLEKLDKINKFNQDPQNTYQMSLNQFSDMTEEEFAAKFLSQKPQEIQDDPETETRKLSAEVDTNIDIEKLRIFLLNPLDWRSNGAVTSVKNQGQCASAFAFSAAGLMESFNIIKNNSVKDFSEQQLLDCVIPANGYQGGGCRYGAWAQHAIDYATRFGILQESQYPYVAVQGKCRVLTSTSGFYPRTYRRVPATVADLMKALDFSPVLVHVDATHMGSYKSGIFNNCSPSSLPNHAALLVGYDRFGNWIIKNEWGTSWGEAGYMRLKAGDNCAILKSNYQIMS